MSEPKFTQGPWRFGVNKTPYGIKISLCRIDSANGTTVAQAAYLYNRMLRGKKQKPPAG